MAEPLVLGLLGVTAVGSLAAAGLALSARRVAASGDSGGDTAAVGRKLDDLAAAVERLAAGNGADDDAGDAATAERLEELRAAVERVERRVEASDGGVPDERLAKLDDLAAVAGDPEEVQGEIAAVRERLSELPDTETVRRPLVNIDDRLQSVNRRLDELEGGADGEGGGASDDLLTAVRSDLADIDDRLGGIERQLGEGGDYDGTTAGESNSSALFDGDGVEEVDDLEEELDFGEDFLGIDDEEDAA